MLKQCEGSHAVAEAVALCRPEVICAYPISPQTHIVEGLGEMVKDGTVKDCEFINVESEFAAMSVAIGASAGGLEALERLFALLPVDTGASFVVIQHLATEHRSMMDTLLARHTTMPVRIIEAGDYLVADHVHLIPPGVMLHLDGTQLRLTPKTPRAFQLPIDRFFWVRYNQSF